MSRRQQLEELLKSDPDDVFLQYALAMEFVSAGDADEGLARLARNRSRGGVLICGLGEEGN